jgi:hypothetical protein
MSFLKLKQKTNCFSYYLFLHKPEILGKMLSYLNVTHIDRSHRSLQGPCLYYCGASHKKSLRMKNSIQHTNKKLEAVSSLKKIDELDTKKMYFISIDNEMHQSRGSDLK